MTPTTSPLVLVTGGAGMVGRHVIAKLLSRGVRVLALVRASELTPASRTARLTIRQGNICDAACVSDLIREVDAVCHLAAYIPIDFEDPSEAEVCLQVNALATLRLALAANARGIRFVWCSSAQAYQHSVSAVDEQAPLFPVERATYYLASKLIGELYVEHLRRRDGLAAITFRVGSCFGPGAPAASVVSHFMRNAMAGRDLQIRDGGIPRYDFVYVEDVAELLTKGLESGEPGIYNAGSGVATSVLELARAVRSIVSDRRFEIEVAPSGNAVPASFSPLSMTKAKIQWGHEPTPLLRGLDKFWRHLVGESREAQC